jgi:hypothetical protein
MSMTRLRGGEIIAGIGAVGLLVTMFFDWFGVDPPGSVKVNEPGLSAEVSINPNVLKSLAQNGWEAFGWLALLLTLAAIVSALAVVLATVLRQPVAWAVGAAVSTTFAGLVGFCAVAITVISQPSIPIAFAGGPQLPDSWISVEPAAYVGLVFAALIPIGGWWIMADERTKAPYSAPPDIEPRPAPPATAPEPPPAAS